MFPTQSPNLLGVLAATIVGFVIGGVWFAPPVFGSRWLQLLKITPEFAAKGRNLGIVVAFFATLLAAYFLGLFIRLAGATTALDGLEIGFLGWLVFSFLIELPVANLERMPTKFVIHVGERLVVFLAMGAILAVWA